MIVKSLCIICHSRISNHNFTSNFSFSSISNGNTKEEILEIDGEQNNNTVSYNSKDVLEKENEEFILKTFCSTFGISLPLTLTLTPARNANSINAKTCQQTIKWNLDKETFPFCPCCKRIAENLVELCQQLETIKHEIDLTKIRIRSEIIKSSQILNNSSNSESKAGRPSLSGELKVKDANKKFTRKKLNTFDYPDRIKILRNLIVGPVLNIPRCDELVPENDTKKNDTALETELRKIDDQDIQIDRQKQQIENLSTENQYHLDSFENSDHDHDNSSDQFCNENENDTEFDDEMDIEMLPLVPSDLGDGEIDNSEKNVFKIETVKSFSLRNSDSDSGLQEQNQDESQIKKLSECYDSSENSDSDDLEDEDFVLSESGSDEEFSKITKRSSERKQKYEYKYRKLLKSASSSRIPDYQPRKNRKTVKCDGEDRYIYGDQFEFTGNETDGFRCSLCPTIKYANQEVLRTHIREIHVRVKGSILCTICGKLLKTPGGLDQHLKIHSEKHLACKICGEKFVSDTNLKSHMYKEHTDKTVVCEYCGKSFRNVGKANLHVRSVHNNEKRHFCDQCGKGFYQMQGLNVHMAVHSADKPFDCQFCGQKFNRKNHRDRHEKQFHGYLKEPSSSSANPVKNSKVKKDPEIQQQQPVEEAPLVATVTFDPEEDNDLKCKLCGLQYNRQNNLTRHLLQIHHINVKGLAWKSRSHKAQHRAVPYTFPIPTYFPVRSSD